MSGGPPHHPHNRPMPAANAAWNHLQVPNFFPRQPQHAHMSSEHPMMHQPTWHTPTTEPLKAPHSHIINLEQMLSERQFHRQAPGVDLSLARGAINGDLPAAPISLSVRDTNKINSLAASALERQGELTKAVSPKPVSPPVAAAAQAHSPTSDKQLSPKIKKVRRVDSILERLNPQAVDGEADRAASAAGVSAPPPAVTSTAAHDENSNSSSIHNASTPHEEDVVSPYSNDNEDSLDSTKSRRGRKRKPAKTTKIAKEPEAPPSAPAEQASGREPSPSSRPSAADARADERPEGNDAQQPDRRRAGAMGPDSPRKTRRKTSSEDETIDKIAAMVGGAAVCTLEEPAPPAVPPAAPPAVAAMVTLAQKKDFVAVEDKLEEMFAGLEDSKSEEPRGAGVLDDAGGVGCISALLNTPSTSQVSSTSCLDDGRKPPRKKRKLKGKQLGDAGKKGKRSLKRTKAAAKSRKMNGKAKFEAAAKDVYAYDSGSNASSSKSRGPFVHISGPRGSPISVSVVNAPANDEDGDAKRAAKAKKFHDDADFRHKVRSKGFLHCSALGGVKYDAQAKDATWLCAFCKRGPYAAEFADNDAHYTPGDLFGPYAITAACGEFARRLSDPYDTCFKSNKIARCLDAAAGASGKPNKRGPRRKASAGPEPSQSQSHSHSQEAADLQAGIVRLGDATYEVWAHEDCIVWSPGIYLVGPRLVGLEEAVWTASNIVCARCSRKGANVCCLKRGCTSAMHLGCAYLARWRLDDESYKAFCAEHAA